MICEAVQKLLDYAKHNKLITEDDIFVVRNELMDTLQLSDLTDGYLDCVTGVYAPPSVYFVDEVKAEEFDKSFPPKEKLKLPGQLF